MRWEASFYEQGSNKFIPENYDLKNLNFPPKIKDMNNFEDDLTKLLKTIKYRVTKSSFQQESTEDIRIIKNIKATLPFADKTSNLYKVPKEQYENLENNAITTSYKKINKKAQNQINR